VIGDVQLPFILFLNQGDRHLLKLPALREGDQSDLIAGLEAVLALADAIAEKRTITQLGLAADLSITDLGLAADLTGLAIEFRAGSAGLMPGLSLLLANLAVLARQTSGRLAIGMIGAWTGAFAIEPARLSSGLGGAWLGAGLCPRLGLHTRLGRARLSTRLSRAWLGLHTRLGARLRAVLHSRLHAGALLLLLIAGRLDREADQDGRADDLSLNHLHILLEDLLGGQFQLAMLLLDALAKLSQLLLNLLTIRLLDLALQALTIRLREMFEQVLEVLRLDHRLGGLDDGFLDLLGVLLGGADCSRRQPAVHADSIADVDLHTALLISLLRRLLHLPGIAGKLPLLTVSPSAHDERSGCEKNEFTLHDALLPVSTCNRDLPGVSIAPGDGGRGGKARAMGAPHPDWTSIRRAASGLIVRNETEAE
jgi:hypothetical protein